MRNLRVLFKKLTFADNALFTDIHRMICGAGKNIKSGVYRRLADLPRCIEHRIAAVCRNSAAEHCFLIDNGNIGRLDI